MACSSTGKCPLQLASEHGHTGILTLLLEHPLVDVNHGDNDGHTPLYLACAAGNEDTVKVLLEQPGINVNEGRTTDGLIDILTTQRNNTTTHSAPTSHQLSTV